MTCYRSAMFVSIFRVHTRNPAVDKNERVMCMQLLYAHVLSLCGILKVSSYSHRYVCVVTWRGERSDFPVSFVAPASNVEYCLPSTFSSLVSSVVFNVLQALALGTEVVSWVDRVACPGQ